MRESRLQTVDINNPYQRPLSGRTQEIPFSDCRKDQSRHTLYSTSHPFAPSGEYSSTSRSRCSWRISIAIFEYFSYSLGVSDLEVECGWVGLFTAFGWVSSGK